MEEPLESFVIIMSEAEYPVAVAIQVFDAVIVAMLSGLQPPLLLYALRPIGAGDLVQFTAMPEQHGRIIRDGRRDFDKLRLRKQMNRTKLVRPDGGCLFMKG